MPCEYLPLGSLVDIKTGAPMSRAKKIAVGDDLIETRVLVPAAMADSRIDDAQLVIEKVSKVKEELFTREGDVKHLPPMIASTSTRSMRGCWSPHLVSYFGRSRNH